MPAARAFNPDLMIVSAGFDAHARDPLAEMRVDRARVRGHVLGAEASWRGSHCGGKLVLLLEGGYDLDALAQSVRACLEVLAGARRETFPGGRGGADAPSASRRTRAALRRGRRGRCNITP